MNSRDRAKLMSAYAVLRDLPDALWTRVEKAARPVRASAGARLFGDGTSCASYPLVVEGSIRVSRSSPEGHEILMYRVSPGESCVVTVVALLGDETYRAVGMAETNLSLFAIPRTVFVDMVLLSPAFRAFVFNSVSRRIGHLLALLDDVAFRRVDQRLASRLLLGPEPISATHQMLADELGTSREVVSRILETFQQSDMIKLGRRRIEIVDRVALERLHRSGSSAD